MKMHRTPAEHVGGRHNSTVLYTCQKAVMLWQLCGWEGNRWHLTGYAYRQLRAVTHGHLEDLQSYRHADPRLPPTLTIT